MSTGLDPSILPGDGERWFALRQPGGPRVGGSSASSASLPAESDAAPAAPAATPPPAKSSGAARPAATDADPAVDSRLVQQTKHEIRVLVHEIHQLAQSELPVQQFHEEFLRRVVAALASHGGAIWTRDGDGPLQLAYQINLPESDVANGGANQHRHGQLLQNVLAAGQPTLVPPHSGGEESEAGNPTDFLLVLGLLRVDAEVVGIVEIFQRAGGGPTTQRGYLRFLAQMCDLASDFLKNRRLRHYSHREELWEHLETFLHAIHQRLDSRATAFTIVNEARRLIDCDRVSLALRKGSGYQIVAVSGLDSFDRRAGEMQKLSRLSIAVLAARRPLWYEGDSRDIPPQIDEPLHAYLDSSHAKLLAVTPLEPARHDLRGDAPTDRREAASPPIGALIIERLSDHRQSPGLSDRVQTVARHAAAALGNALEHESLFLLPLWQAVGRTRWIVAARQLPKTIAAAAALLATAVSLAVVPADFKLGARGVLQPSVRREVFAPLDGIITAVPVRHEQLVALGDPVLEMTNTELEVQISELVGRLRATQERMRALERSRLEDRRLTIDQQNEISGELFELAQVAAGAERELALAKRKQESLVVRSPLDGQVVTWNVQETLLRRPVQRGQSLLTIVDPGSRWELEVYMPEKRMGHLTRAVRQSRRQLDVVFLLASHPDREFHGQVVEINRLAEVREGEGNSVLLRVAIADESLPELHYGTTVAARVHCGRRAIGFVWFHEVIETIHAKLLFWI